VAGPGINRGKLEPRQRFSRGRVFPSTGILIKTVISSWIY
jgi:hypothetical protein